MEGVVEGFEVGWREGKGLELDWLVWRVVGMGEGRTVIRVDQVVVVVVEVDGRDVLVVAAGCGHSVSTSEVCVMGWGGRSSKWLLGAEFESACESELESESPRFPQAASPSNELTLQAHLGGLAQAPSVGGEWGCQRMQSANQQPEHPQELTCVL